MYQIKKNSTWISKLGSCFLKSCSVSESSEIEPFKKGSDTDLNYLAISNKVLITSQ